MSAEELQHAGADGGETRRALAQLGEDDADASTAPGWRQTPVRLWEPYGDVETATTMMMLKRGPAGTGFRPPLVPYLARQLSWYFTQQMPKRWL